MATLNSPGVSVTLVDESTTISAPTGTVPFILLATAQDKLNQSNTTATYTTANTAGQVVLVGSQRELVTNFGAPIFYNSGGTPINGYELNEYGLLAAYSALGVSDAAYIMRANIDLSALPGSVNPISASPANGTIWFDTASTSWGMFQWNSLTQTFNLIQPTNVSGSNKLFVITDPTQTSDDNNSVPLASIGKPSDYAVVTTNINNPVWYQNPNGVWVEVGTAAWQQSLPAVIGNTIITSSNTVVGTLTLNGISIALNGNLTSVIGNVNSANISGVTANAVSSKLALYATTLANGGNGNIIINGSACANLGLTANSVVFAPAFQLSPNTNVPAWLTSDETPEPTGSVWFKTTSTRNGANFSVKTFNTVTGNFVTNSVPVASNDAAINYLLDPTAGGINIPVGSFYMQVGSPDFTLNLLSRKSGVTETIGNIASPTFTVNSTFSISTSQIGVPTFSDAEVITISGTDNASFVSAINNANISGITATVLTSGIIQIENTFGGTFILTDGINTPLAAAGISTGIVSNWEATTYAADNVAPTADPAVGTLWYYDDPTQFDIMINTGTAWRGYRNVMSDARGYNLSSCDVNGPIVSFSTPSAQSNGNVLVPGDIWINTSDLDNGISIYRYQPNGSSLGVAGWVQIDLTDHDSSNGIIFADARWAVNGNTDPVTGTMSTIAELSLSDYTDPDVPSFALYPRGTLLFNTRRSALNVKTYSVNQFNASNTVGSLPNITSAWVSASGNDTTGVAYLGRNAQRHMVVMSLISAVENSTELEQETLLFNLMVCPGYPELMSTLKNLNIARNETAFSIGDSPLRLAADTNSLNNWVTNVNNAVTDGDNGIVTEYDYLGVYYPAGLSTDLGGNSVVVPSSHMILSTLINSDNISYEWFAPAGTRRGLVNNATALGYIDENANFIPVSLNTAQRDVLFENQINPIANLKGYGPTVYGQLTRSTNTLMDHINIARLILYIRQELDLIGKQYVFEQNDAITRLNLANQVTTFLNSLISQRGLADFVVICNTSNNTPTTIAANELFCDVAVQPISSVDFIYIPVTLTNNVSSTS